MIDFFFLFQLNSKLVKKNLIELIISGSEWEKFNHKNPFGNRISRPNTTRTFSRAHEFLVSRQTRILFKMKIDMKEKTRSLDDSWIETETVDSVAMGL